LYRPIIHFGLVSSFYTRHLQLAAPTDYTVLKFSDEFKMAHRRDQVGYDLGGTNGWGNNESQSYTNAADNVIVSGGNLKINSR
jgi:hypothetical protein